MVWFRRVVEFHVADMGLYPFRSWKWMLSIRKLQDLKSEVEIKNSAKAPWAVNTIDFTCSLFTSPLTG